MSTCFPDLWDPPPGIVMKFSQDPTQNKGLRVTYSTDLETTDPGRAKRQARMLVERHFDNIPTHLRVGEKSRLLRRPKNSTVRCYLKDNEIVIRNIGIIAAREQGDRPDTQRIKSVPQSDRFLLSKQILRLPGGSFSDEYKEDGWQFQIDTRFSYDVWQKSVGTPTYEGTTLGSIPKSLRTK